MRALGFLQWKLHLEWNITASENVWSTKTDHIYNVLKIHWMGFLARQMLSFSVWTRLASVQGMNKLKSAGNVGEAPCVCHPFYFHLSQLPFVLVKWSVASVYQLFMLLITEFSSPKTLATTGNLSSCQVNPVLHSDENCFRSCNMPFWWLPTYP